MPGADAERVRQHFEGAGTAAPEGRGELRDQPRRTGSRTRTHPARHRSAPHRTAPHRTRKPYRKPLIAP
ncbi:hypothetical protein ACWC0C_26085 [Streptomyces sp. NPDC001709]